MIYILGIITGILIGIFIILTEMWLSNRSIGVAKLREIIKKNIRPAQAKILYPRSQTEIEIAKIIEENDRKNKDTSLEEILKVFNK